MKIYHNPRCAKSRAGLQYLQSKVSDFETIKYLSDGISESELADVIKKTGKRPIDFIRTQEKDYRDNFKGKEFTDSEWIKVMVEYPKLIQRPLVVKNDKAVLANPPENIDQIL
jgi:arsenate reductase (glutaredoxin)